MNLNETNEPGGRAAVPAVPLDIVAAPSGGVTHFESTEEFAAREGLPVALLLPYEAQAIAQGIPLVVPVKDGDRALVRLFTAEEYLVFRRAAADKFGVPAMLLEQARELVRPMVDALAETGAATAVERVSDERIQEILKGLAGFVGCCAPELAAHLDEAIMWAKTQPDVAAAAGPLLGEANVQLVDGTVIEWQPEEKSWAVTVSDVTEAEVAR